MTQNEESRTHSDPANSTPPSDSAEHTAELGRSRRYWQRRLWLDCGCSDPCRCDYRDRPTPKRVDAYADAVAWLEDQGLAPAALLPECRVLWRRGGSDRVMAETVVRRWAS